MWYVSKVSYADYAIRLAVTIVSGAIGCFFGALFARRLLLSSPYLLNLVLGFVLLLIGTLSFVIPYL